MELSWIDVRKELPDENHKNRGHGLCNVLVVAIRAGIPSVEQCLYTKIKGFQALTGRKHINETVTYWMYLPDPPTT